MGEANTSSIDDDLLLKNFYAEVSEVERDNEVARILSCFKLNAFEYLNLPFDSSPEEVKKQYRKLSLLVHPDKCKHPQAKEAFSALAKAQQLLLDPQEREYLVNQINAAREELRAKRKKQLKKDTASKLKSLVDEGKYEQEYEKSDDFQLQLKLKVRELLTDQEWRRRKMQMRISEEEGRLKKDEEESKEMWKRKREHEEQWEGTRENRVSSWRDFMKGGKKVKKGEIRPPKLKTEDPNKSYVQRPVKRDSIIASHCFTFSLLSILNRVSIVDSLVSIPSFPFIYSSTTQIWDSSVCIPFVTSLKSELDTDSKWMKVCRSQDKLLKNKGDKIFLNGYDANEKILICSKYSKEISPTDEQLFLAFQNSLLKLDLIDEHVADIYKTLQKRTNMQSKNTRTLNILLKSANVEEGKIDTKIDEKITKPQARASQT
ncbi:unnamed protein product [Lactuca saligna]|uniref:J domain-containing protein n=1 Tax=Lactuca saligna TaxID=75948 RepID=A0AA35YP43_LACSI|nr:unnamed protein product [Lactuca saligna]CAI9277575.1 unnamed protein product [Lactuca saligna]